jgi:high-affinity iron transporter
VVSILLAALGKPRRASSVPIWFGVGAALTFYKSVLSTTGQEGLGGSLSVLAVFLVTWMIFWMRRTARGLSAELKEKVSTALAVSTSALALTAFLAVGREGIETALFLWTAAQASGTTTGPLIGAALGIACAVVLCVLLYRRAVKIRLDKFFNRTGILLIVIAAGVLSYGPGDLQDAGWLPGHLWVAFNDGSWYVSLFRGITNLTLSMTWLQAARTRCSRTRCATS